MPKINKQFRDYEDYLKEELRDPELAQEYLNIAIEEYNQDNDSESFLLALKDVAMAQGGIQKIAKRAKLNRQNLYRVLSAQSEPKINTVGLILNGLGFRLEVRKLHARESVKL